MSSENLRSKVNVKDRKLYICAVNDSQCRFIGKLEYRVIKYQYGTNSTCPNQSKVYHLIIDITINDAV